MGRKLQKGGQVGSSEFVDIKAIDPTLKKELGSSDRRVKRSEPQIKYLQTVYKQMNGKCPTKKQRIEMAKSIEMNEHQIYKWFWEAKKKSLNVDS